MIVHPNKTTHNIQRRSTGRRGTTEEGGGMRHPLWPARACRCCCTEPTVDTVVVLIVLLLWPTSVLRASPKTTGLCYVFQRGAHSLKSCRHHDKNMHTPRLQHLALTPPHAVPRRVRTVSFMPTGFGGHHVSDSFPSLLLPSCDSWS